MLSLNSAPGIISVAELNSLSREVLERRFPLIWVSGEISGLTRAASGHCYFNLKDAFAQVRCVCFRSRLQSLDWSPADGNKVEVCANVTLYEPRGEFQLNVETVRRAGLGALYEAFEKLKARLAAEGLFDPARKKTIPRFPESVGIVTSLVGAALRDVLSILRRRMPAIRVIVYPTQVQGEGAAFRIAAALNAASLRDECEVVILCRGGGSIEDLWAFNEEIVARAIRASTIPVVSGVGHETDFTIADFAADVRAATPSAAAELVSPSAPQLAAQLSALRERVLRSARRVAQMRAQQVDYLSRRLMPPAARIANEERRLRDLHKRLRAGFQQCFSAHSAMLSELSRAFRHRRRELAAAVETCEKLRVRLRASMRRNLERLEMQAGKARAHLLHLSPQSVLERGYSITQRDDGKVVRDSREIEIGGTLKVTLARGHAIASVTTKT